MIRITVDQSTMMLDMLSIIQEFLSDEFIEVQWSVIHDDGNPIFKDSKDECYNWMNLFVYYIIPCVSYIDDKVKDDDFVVISLQVFENLWDFVDPFEVQRILYKSNDPVQYTYDKLIELKNEARPGVI